MQYKTQICSVFKSVTGIELIIEQNKSFDRVAKVETVLALRIICRCRDQKVNARPKFGSYNT